jgi:hypothetical protein
MITSNTTLSGELLKVTSRITESEVSDILDDGAAYWLDQVRKNFLAEKDIHGNPFERSRAGSIRKAGGYTVRDGKKYTGTGTLFETGRLFHSIHLEDPAPNERALVTDVDYAESLIGRWQFIGISSRVDSEIRNIIDLRIQGLLGL